MVLLTAGGTPFLAMHMYRPISLRVTWGNNFVKIIAQTQMHATIIFLDIFCLVQVNHFSRHLRSWKNTESETKKALSEVAHFCHSFKRQFSLIVLTFPFVLSLSNSDHLSLWPTPSNLGPKIGFSHFSQVLRNWLCLDHIFTHFFIIISGTAWGYLT